MYVYTGINKRPYIESQMTPSHLTLTDLERSKSRSLRLQSLISRKAAELGHMLLLNINFNLNRKAYGEYIDAMTFELSDFERSILRSLRF